MGLPEGTDMTIQGYKNLAFATAKGNVVDYFWVLNHLSVSQACDFMITNHSLKGE